MKSIKAASTERRERRYPKRRTQLDDEVNADLLATPIDGDGFWGRVDNYRKVRELAQEAARL